MAVHFSLVLSLTICGLTISSPSAIDPIIDKLVELSEDSHYNNFDLSAVIRFNITGYKEFALKQPKPYHLFVLLSANQGVGAHTDEKDPVFFGVIDAYTNSEIQRVHELKAVPLLFGCVESIRLTEPKLWSYPAQKRIWTTPCRQITCYEGFAKFGELAKPGAPMNKLLTD
ncbi:hypothetical protein Pmar_PMAR009899 [Perkinsus marinus ATCC 50983]|uniref:Uncharacterized protein n=1 Tax=Perkinsus marinus (strain ATCC 50983 / TXsc) TaxID=423536 RepID=C5KIB9_PERM5|nr:hypothetical protein Pmar_PMAR009899 [Perkinsus marinus ATCC 50983]EER15782.1 hypothetical protein Pmar_PMAR009899 [Perkinsus marinus ATCC 50983]|eukprot:XP_002783986.1 hypothetical protein Pmar_PMAR009899 [Perkinsus marinus ATCC 50983]